MKKVKLIILFALFFAKTDGFSVLEGRFPNDIIGIYWLPKKDATIKIYSKGQQYLGKPEWRKSTKNDINSLKLRVYVGISLFGSTEIFEIITKK